MNNLFIIHGWDGFPGEGWFPWLKKEAEKEGFAVSVLAMPNPATPVIKEWVSFLEKNIKPDKNTFIVAHSIGSQAVMRFLENALPIKGVVFVGGWLKLSKEALPDAHYRSTAKPWLETKIDFEKVRKNAGKITAIFSDDDPYVPIENIELFKKNLNAKIIILKGKGHLSQEHGVYELPEVLEELNLFN